MHRMTLPLLVALLTLASGTSFSGDKTALTWQSFDSSVSEARKANKKILVDVYTDWCKWCKKMDKDVYEDGKVIEYLSKHYVTVKLNAESPAMTHYKDKSLSERELASAFGVTGYPTTLFLEPGGELITSVSSYYPADRFINIARFIGGDHYKTMKFEEFLKKAEPSAPAR